MFLLKDKVPDTCLLMDFVHKPMEFFEELVFLLLQVLELLESNFVLPFDFLGGLIVVSDLLLRFGQLLHNLVVLLLFLLEDSDLFTGLSEWLNHLVVFVLLVHLLLLLIAVLLLCVSELVLQLLDNI